MLKILIDPGNALPTTGIGVYTRSLMNALKTHKSSTIHTVESVISSYSLSFRPIHRLVYLYRLRKQNINNFEGVDVVHFTNVYTPVKRNKIGFVSTITDLDAIYFPETYSLRYRYYFTKTVKNTLERSDIVLTISEASKKNLIERYSNYESKVRSLPIGLSEDFEEYVKGTSWHERPERTMLFVGNLSKKKNTAWLIKSVYKGIRSGAFPRFKLILAGSPGYGFNEIKEALKEAGDIVEWKKGLSKKEIAELYIKASVVVLPSQSEGFGIPLIEAMFCGKPIVASSIPSSIEVASDAAQYFSLGDVDEFYAAVIDAFEDRNRDKRMEYSRRRIEKFRWVNLVHEYAKMYDDLFKSL